MTKRKASVALENGNENDKDKDRSNSTSSVTAGQSEIIGPGTQQNGSSTKNGEQKIASNSQSDNSNSSTNTNCNIGNQNRNKKERADNWSTAEIQVLHLGIETRREIFCGPPSQSSKKNRESAWEAITREVNAVSTTPRSLTQVMKKFKNEKCRAKRKFSDPTKDGHNTNLNSNTSGSSSNNSNNNVASGTTNAATLGAQNHTTNGNHQQAQQAQQQPQQQSQQQHPHHMTSADSLSSTQTPINVVKLAPQNVAKTMIDLPGHIQQIQMPNEDIMLMMVPPEMDGILSGVNIVSDGNHHHFQKCPGTNSLSNHQHNHHSQQAIQTINPGQTLMNGTMSNGVMTARTIPATSMCSLVYSTGTDICPSDQHITASVGNQTALSANHIGLNAQNLLHHRTTLDQNQHQQHNHQMQQQQQHQQQPQTHPQQPLQQPHQTHQPIIHQTPHLQQGHLTTTSTVTNSAGGVAVESQLKNLLFNLLIKDGQNSPSAVISSNNQDYNKQRNDMLAVIANSLNKIESHLSKISKVAGTLLTQGVSLNPNESSDTTAAPQMTVSNASDINMNTSNGDNSTVNLPNIGGNQRCVRDNSNDDFYGD